MDSKQAGPERKRKPTPVNTRDVNCASLPCGRDEMPNNKKRNYLLATLPFNLKHYSDMYRSNCGMI